MVGSSFEETAMPSNEAAAITAIVQTYLDGLYEGDADKIAKAFHPTSSLASEDKGALTQLPREQWLERVRSRKSAKAQGLERRDEIVQVDQSGPTTAFVKVKCQLPPRFFTDYLLLLKVEGRWQIVQKVFATELRQ
jgi:hypothetical protein